MEFLAVLRVFLTYFWRTWILWGCRGLEEEKGNILFVFVLTFLCVLGALSFCRRAKVTSGLCAPHWKIVRVSTCKRVGNNLANNSSPECTTTSQWTAITSDLCFPDEVAGDFPQREAHLTIFIDEGIATASVSYGNNIAQTLSFFFSEEIAGSQHIFSLHYCLRMRLVASPCEFSDRTILLLLSIALCFCSCIARCRAMPPQGPPSWFIARLCWKHAVSIAALATISFLSRYRGIAAILLQIAIWNATTLRIFEAIFVGVSRGNTIRGNRTERFWEGNLPLRGSLRGSLRGRVFRGFQRFSEVFRGF